MKINLQDSPELLQCDKVFQYQKKVKEMNTQQKEQQLPPISEEKLLAFVRTMMGESRGREDDEHPLPPGPWDPVVRIALEHLSFFRQEPQVWRTMELGFNIQHNPWKAIFAIIAATHPEIWDIIGGGPGFGSEVELNPQPLPPRFAFLVSLAKTVINRAELIQEIADATRREGEQQGIIIVGGYIQRFADDICGNDFRFKWPFPGPRPNWLANEVSGMDLMVMATQFEQAAKETFSQDLRQNLADTSAKLIAVGMSKMQ